jgi:membrane protease subunit HflC
MPNNTALKILGIVALVIFLSLFTVTEGEKAIVLRLGKLVKDYKTQQVEVLNPGLHIKLPLIESIRTFDARIQTLDIKSSRIVTKEKKDVIVDYYVKWRIKDFAAYYKSTGGNEFTASTLLEQQLNTSLRAEFGRRTISELVSAVRDDVMDSLRKKAEKQAQDLGITVVDVRIKGIELPENTSAAIYQRMRADMRKIANRHRADGQAEAEAVRADADAKVTVLVADAASQGQKIRAQGNAEAAKIYADAYQKNPNFYKFYRNLQAYKKVFRNKQDLLLLDQKDAFFDFLKQPLINK